MPALRRCALRLPGGGRAGRPLRRLCGGEAPKDDWRVLEPEDLVLAVAGVLASAAADRPGERVHVQPALEARGILADSVDVHLAVEKLRRRHGWVVGAVEGLPGYRLEAWPHRFTRSRR